MKTFSLVISLAIIFITTRPSELPRKNITPRISGKTLNVNADSLRVFIKHNGWDINSLSVYQRYLVNSPINFSIELGVLDNLPGHFEKTFLGSLILKREQKYKEMSDTLIACLSDKPLYYPYYDELNFSSRAARQETLLKNKIEAIKNYPQAQLEYLLGLIEISKDNSKEAVHYLTAALKLDTADYNILYQLSYAYRNAGNYETANITLQNAIRYAGNDQWLHTKAIIAQGSLFYLSHKIEEADKLYQDGNKNAIELKDRYDEAVSLIDLGIISDEKGDINAKSKYTAAADIASEINDQELKALAFSELGVSFSYTNNLVEAKQNYLNSFHLYEETGNRTRLSLLANNIGKVYLGLFNYETAMKFYREGLNYSGDNKRSTALNLIGLGDCYANLSNYSKALNYYRKAQDISAEIKDVSLSADALSGLGDLNYNIDNFNNALKYYSSAAELNNSSNAFSKAEIFNKLGLTYLQLDSVGIAENYLRQSINISESNKDYYTEALSAGDLADYYLDKGRPDAAQKYFIIAQQASHKDGSKYISAITYMLSGKLNAERNDFGKSKSAYESAISIAAELNQSDILIEANYSLAKQFELYNLEQQADDYYKSAVKLVDKISFSLVDKDEIQISYFTSKSEVYEAYINYLLKQKRFEEAFNIIDRSRSRNTMQNLTTLKLQELVGNKQTIDKLYDYEWVINSGVYAKPVADSINFLYNNLKSELCREQPELKKYLVSQNIKGIQNIQNNIDGSEYLISIYPAPENVYVFLISKNTFKPFTLHIPISQFTAYIKAVSPYYNSENNGQNYYNKDLFSFNTLGAYNLYKNILQPVFNSIPENSDVIISPSPEMISVPCEFLIKSYNTKQSPYNYNDKDYLIYHYNISYTPSAAVYLNQKENNLANNGKVLLVGNPKVNNLFNSYAERRGLLEDINSLHRNIPLLPLKYSADEVSKISDIIAADKVLTGDNATETNFKINAPLSKIIHLSTHSFIFNKQPVIFFSNSFDPADDGFLETGEIVKMKLNSDLVVLSSCNSGKGIVDKSEGVLGMTKAFFEAGAKSVVVSLWEVDDKYTSDLMSLFYYRLSQGYDKSQALRYAKIDFIKKYSPNPYYWSAFVLSGNISQLTLKTKLSTTPYLVGIVLLIGMAGLFISLKTREKSKNQLYD